MHGLVGIRSFIQSLIVSKRTKKNWELRSGSSPSKQECDRYECVEVHPKQKITDSYLHQVLWPSPLLNIYIMCTIMSWNDQKHRKSEGWYGEAKQKRKRAPKKCEPYPPWVCFSIEIVADTPDSCCICNLNEIYQWKTAKIIHCGELHGHTNQNLVGTCFHQRWWEMFHFDSDCIHSSTTVTLTLLLPIQRTIGNNKRSRIVTTSSPNMMTKMAIAR